MICSIKRSDILNVRSTIKFLYKDCDVTLTRLNNMVDIGIIKVHKEGYLIEKHGERILKTNYKFLLGFLDEQIPLLEKVYKKVLMREEHINRLLEPPIVKNTS